MSKKGQTHNVRSMEERLEAQKQKVLEIETKIANKDIRVFWRSAIRAIKSELNTNKELSPSEKLIQFHKQIGEKLDEFNLLPVEVEETEE